jgi:murein DD-endopeptidase MepM/ murein hydrolase activator NlpD
MAAAAVLAVGCGAAFISRPEQVPAGTGIPIVSAAAPEAAPDSSVPLSKRTLVLAGAAELPAALLHAGLEPGEAAEAAQAAARALEIKPGGVRAVLSLDMSGPVPQLARLEVSFEDSSGAVVTRGEEGGFSAVKVAPSLTTEIVVKRGEIDAESFYSSAVAAGVTDILIPDFAKAFAYDFDFQREIHPGDVFEVAFEQEKNAAGQPVGQPRLVYASLTTAEKSRSLYWFSPPGEDAGWFDGNGSSVVRSLMRTPVDGARVSSKFGMRFHPVLMSAKLHKGTDFAAPTGTPIYASGNAVVEFAGFKGANGNYVRLLHDNGWRTLYLHMNRIAPTVTPGARVAQAQQIGEVGTTGRSTGPHLHYEVHIDGQPTDPLSIQTDAGRTLTGEARAAFIKERDRIDVARASRSG